MQSILDNVRETLVGKSNEQKWPEPLGITTEENVKDLFKNLYHNIVIMLRTFKLRTLRSHLPKARTLYRLLNLKGVFVKAQTLRKKTKCRRRKHFSE